MKTTADTDPVVHLSELPVGTTKLARVDGHRICLARTAAGVFAIDNACPHMGYGLTTGALAGDLLTCEWHNWKFRVSDGVCVVGEEDVVTHDVTIDANGGVRVRLRERSAEQDRPRLLSSLRRGIEHDYIGQVARDTIRLLQMSENPGELVWEAIAWGAPRAEFGWGHAIASATDALAAVGLYTGDERAMPIVQAIAGISETERGRVVNPLPAPARELTSNAGGLFRAFVEAEDVEKAQALVLAAIEAGHAAVDLRPWFASVVADHHLSYGHGAIYVQKAFQLLELIGWERSSTVLPYLVPALVYGTREDRLPYMRPFMRELNALDLHTLSDAPTAPDWDGRDALVKVLLTPARRMPLDAVVEAIRHGAGIDGVIDAVVLAASERMLRYDTAGERDLSDDFGWLDITHGVTYANAARWLYRHEPGPETTRLALFTAFLAHYTGRHEWHTRVGPKADVARPAEDLGAYGNAAIRASLHDVSGAFIVQAHAIKLSRAAAEEANHLTDATPLDAAWRFMHAPRQDRFVASSVQQSIDFLAGRVRRD